MQLLLVSSYTYEPWELQKHAQEPEEGQLGDQKQASYSHSFLFYLTNNKKQVNIL